MNDEHYQIDGDGLLLPWFDPMQFSPEDQRRIGRLVSWSYDRSASAYRVKRRAPHKIGRVKVANRVLSVVPDFSSENFAVLFLYSGGVDLRRFLQNDAGTVASTLGGTASHFDVLVGSLIAAACENIASGYLARTYERRDERLRTLRGRVDWLRTSLQPKHLGAWCTYELITSDNLLNQVVLAGLDAARGLSLPPGLARRLDRLTFAWTALTRRRVISLADVIAAERSLTRLTETYRPALVLCRMLLFGFTPTDLLAGRGASLQLLEFDLAALFERFVLRFVREHLEGSSYEVQYQDAGRTNIVNAYGNVYKPARPDFTLLKSGRPYAVLDAKFKPHYVSRRGSGRLRSRNKLDEADIYQLLFYIDRLPKDASNEGYIIAPRLSSAEERIEPRLRQIHWKAGAEDAKSIKVLELNLIAAMDSLRSGALLPIDELAVWLAALTSSSEAQAIA